jgi:AcrR family transcriptional regulator
MPKIVDHDARRKDITRAVLKLVAQSGVRGTDIRSVAKEGGWSTGLINHYYTSKRQLLVAALRESVQGVADQMAAVEHIEVGTKRIQAILEAGMPLGGKRTATCRIFFHFSSEWVNDPELSSELAGYYAYWRQYVQSAIEDAQQDNQFLAHDPASLSEILVGLAEGLGIQSLFDPKMMNEERLRTRIMEIITCFNTPKLA